MNSEIRGIPQAPEGVTVVTVPFKEIVGTVSDSVKLKKLLVNMIYVGLLAELLEIPAPVLEGAIAHQFGDKTSVLEVNRKAIEAGRAYAKAELTNLAFPFRVRELPGQNEGKMLIDGNSAAAMGLVFSGCTVAAWYPITPSSSVIETFSQLAEKYRVNSAGERDFAIVQAEDELASICMVLGAGWAGARAMTATSGPGLSLMSEAAGLAYYAEIPAVIWDVQRVGPSTGLPTRTMQGDLLSAYYLSHGDTKHIVLLPGTPNECFAFAQLAFDLAETLQTLVIVLSDLDMGMNFHVAHKFEYPTATMDRGKVLNAEELTKIGRFQRYKDVDQDGIPYRTLPGTEHPLAAYFTRGTGHDEAGLYTENAEVYKANVDRLARKFETARTMVPVPKTDSHAHSKIGLVIYGSSHEATAEARMMLKNDGIDANCLRLLALPLTQEFENFLVAHERVYIIEQNRDAQLMSIVRAESPQHSLKCHSVLQYDGLPMEAAHIHAQILAHEEQFRE